MKLKDFIQQLQAFEKKNPNANVQIDTGSDAFDIDEPSISSDENVIYIPYK